MIETEYKQISIYNNDQIKGKTIKYFDINLDDIIIVFTDKTYIYYNAENECDENIYESLCVNSKGKLTTLGKILEINPEPILKKQEERIKKDQEDEYKLYLKLKEKYESK